MRNMPSNWTGSLKNRKVQETQWNREIKVLHGTIIWGGKNNSIWEVSLPQIFAYFILFYTIQYTKIRKENFLKVNLEKYDEEPKLF